MAIKHVDFLAKTLLDNAVDIIAGHEGFVPHVYKDTVGIDTIGYGFNLESGTFSEEKVARWRKDGIKEEEARMILKEHIKRIESRIKENHAWYKLLSDSRKLAILDMSFNMGNGWLNKWTNTVGFIRANKFKSAALAISRSKYAEQVKVRAWRNMYALVKSQYPTLESTKMELMKTTFA